MSDAVTVLRDLEIAIEPDEAQMWRLRAPDEQEYRCCPTPPFARITASIVRQVQAGRCEGRRPLLIGESITAAMLDRALAGEFDVLTLDLPRLIVRGKAYEDVHDPIGPQVGALAKRTGRRPAWIRWAVMRCLLLLSGAPLSQGEVARRLGCSQQAVSLGAQQLADVVTVTSAGLRVRDRARLLDEWTADYIGPGGHEFGWYSLDAPVEQTRRGYAAADVQGAKPLLSGDVAADRLAPWKMPSRGRIYVTKPVSLAASGFVPAPLEEASLVLCIPRDPTIWKLSRIRSGGTHNQYETADLLTVYWDVATSGDVDSLEAARTLHTKITTME